LVRKVLLFPLKKKLSKDVAKKGEIKNGDKGVIDPTKDHEFYIVTE
jgi:hypothetical protein